jgi:hypothetical protein
MSLGFDDDTLGSPCLPELNDIARLGSLWADGPKLFCFGSRNTSVIVSGEGGRVSVPHLAHQPVNIMVDW